MLDGSGCEWADRRRAVLVPSWPEAPAPRDALFSHFNPLFHSFSSNHCRLPQAPAAAAFQQTAAGRPTRPPLSAMFSISACIGAPAVSVHGSGQQPASNELPSTPRGSGDLRGSLRRTLLAQSSLVERGSDLWVNIGLESPRADSGDAARSHSFQRLPSAAAPRVRPQCDGEQPGADAAAGSGGDWGGKVQEPRQQRRRLDWGQQQQPPPQQQQQPEELGSSLLPADAPPASAAGPLTAALPRAPPRPALQPVVDPFEAAFDQLMQDGDLEDEGAEPTESDASSLPEEGPSQLSAFHWTASRKRLEECLEAAEAETRAHAGEDDNLCGSERLAERLAALELVCVQAVGDGNWWGGGRRGMQSGLQYCPSRTLPIWRPP
ncbi:MAG: hypothetical protein WCP73_02985 [Eubacteriales bacterium]